MATSTVPRSMATLLSMALLVGSGMLASAQSVQPSNATLPSSESDSVTNLKLSGTPIFDMRTFTIAPLTEEMGKGQNSVRVGAIAIAGVLTSADYTTVGNLTSSDIAYINCDPNGSNIDPSSVVETAGAGDPKPKAIILYSMEAEECNLTGSYTYTSIFTMTSLEDSKAVLDTLGLFTGSGQPSSVAANIGVINGTETSGPSPSPTPNIGPGGPAPTTAVAMSILYSITGIITLLFLVIIATGAIRAHRHPERYGPRNGFPGRPRQSRAKGLARAMLETLPIVKFGDPEPAKPGVGDIELEDGRSTTDNTATTSDVAAAATTANKKDERPKSPSNATNVPIQSGLGAAQAESVKSGEEAAPSEHDLGCSICTEDFTTGEDVRVLPCHHKYHPACIDPWLLNVSGTCPLCRHDLRPVTSAPSNAEGNDEGGELPPPLSLNEAVEHAEGNGGSAHQPRRVSRLLDLSRLRNAPPDERIAALRQLRAESRRAGEIDEDNEEPSRRARLTSRLRDTFRIRTRAQDVSTS